MPYAVITRTSYCHEHAFERREEQGMSIHIYHRSEKLSLITMTNRPHHQLAYTQMKSKQTEPNSESQRGMTGVNDENRL